MRVTSFYAFAAATIATTSFVASTLQDNPIISQATQYLDGEGWQVTNGLGTTIGASVPGDLISDLEIAGVIGDPLYSMNWVPMHSTPNAPIWDNSTWTYSLTFDASTSILSSPTKMIVFDGIKMVADITLNGAYLGYINDQFLRYSWDVSSVLLLKNNVLTVAFNTSLDPRNLPARFIGSSGGWDWEAYSNTATTAGTRTFSKGIWKSVYLSGIGTTSITHIVPHVYYNGTYPSSPLTDATAGPWTVNVRVFFNTPAAAAGRQGTLTVAGAFIPSPSSISTPVTLTAGNSSVLVPISVPAGFISLWWPATLGNQILYAVNVTFTDSVTNVILSDSRNFGFRVGYLITVNDTANPEQYSGVDGSGDFTMRFKVNGADLYARGGNIIPMDSLEGRFTAEAHAQLVESSVAANMNTFRIWGGGLYSFDAFYDAADRMGVVMYHDMMYAGDGRVNPFGSSLEDSELRHQVRRLSHHPSIFIWDSCNECGGGGIWDSFVATTVAEEDSSRPIWPSCPAAGWTSGVDMLSGLPNGNALVTRPTSTSGSVNAGTRDTGVIGRPENVRIWTAPCTTTAAAGANCTFVDGLDYDQGFIGKTPAAPDAPTCCNLCAADPTDCYAASFYENTCYFKPTGKSFSWGTGVVSVFPPGATPPPVPARTIETHGYYQHGGGFPAVNGPVSLSAFDTLLPLSLAATGPRGAGQYGIFASEFGASVFSSFESMAPTLPPQNWAIHGGVPADTCDNGQWPSNCQGENPMAQRNYPCANFLLSYGFADALSNANTTGKDAFQKQLYLCMLTQALYLRADIENRRSDIETGTSIWQINEIWPTGGWGSIEYGSVSAVTAADIRKNGLTSATTITPGQVLGGRWKPLQHFFANHLYLDQITACGFDGRCFMRNDDPINGFTGSVSISFVHLSTGAVTSVQASIPISVPRGAASFAWYCVGSGNITAGCAPMTAALSAAGCSPSGTDCLLLLNLTATIPTTVVADVNWQLLTIPGNLTLPIGSAATSVTFVVGAEPNADGSVPVTVTASGGNGVALYINLNTQAQGRFSDNVFHLASGAPGGLTRTVNFIPFGGHHVDFGLLTSTLRVEHLAQSMSF